MEMPPLPALEPVIPTAKDARKAAPKPQATAEAKPASDEDFGPVIHATFVDIPEEALPTREAVNPEMKATPQTPVNPQKVREFARKQAALKERQEFLDRIAEARRPLEPKPYVKPPMPPRIQEQTNAEMEEGKRQSALHEARKVNLPPKPVDPSEGTTTEVMSGKSDDPRMTYVPDQKKGQGLQANASVKQLA